MQRLQTFFFIFCHVFFTFLTVFLILIWTFVHLWLLSVFINCLWHWWRCTTGWLVKDDVTSPWQRHKVYGLTVWDQRGPQAGRLVPGAPPRVGNRRACRQTNQRNENIYSESSTKDIFSIIDSQLYGQRRARFRCKFLQCSRGGRGQLQSTGTMSDRMPFTMPLMPHRSHNWIQFHWDHSGSFIAVHSPVWEGHGGMVLQRMYGEGE